MFLAFFPILFKIPECTCSDCFVGGLYPCLKYILGVREYKTGNIKRESVFLSVIHAHRGTVRSTDITQ